MKTQLSSLHRAGGFTYITVVITMIVVGSMLAAYIKMISVQNQLISRSQTWNRSVPVLEAGVEEAMAHLNKNGTPDSSGNMPTTLGTDGWTGNATIGWSKFGWIDQDFYFVQISSWVPGSHYPFINSTGYVMQLPAYAMNRPFSPFVASVLDDLVRGGKFSRRVVQCTTTNNPTFSKGIVARRGINMNGNNVTVDSFDSSTNTASTNGRWDSTKRRSNGDVASNDTITNSINVGNANIYGRVSTGPFGTVALGPNGAVGDRAWHEGGNRGIQPGWSTDDMNVEFPDVVMPSVAWGAAPGDLIFNASGNYQIPGTVTGSIVIDAPNVVLRIDGGLSFTGTKGLTIGSNANATIYLNCASAKITGNGIINPGRAKNCIIYGTSALTDLDIGGNGEATCVVYAPYANVKLHGGGTGDADFQGALMANSFTFTGHYNVHYDESLGRMGLWRGFTITSWNER